MNLVPGRFAAEVTLLPDGPLPVTTNVAQAWFKSLDVTLSNYGNLNLQGDETLIKVPDHELNPAGNGREIRPRDRIVVAGTAYRVLSARLMSVRTVWECVVRKELN
ncbi:hypothetical protein [Schlesneria sp. T3-172]|uniref:hypothetical protein n=1 Tax=Schlesneria sphaerica TaxID=3373610 RepID=UPI0037C7E48E